MRVCKKCNSSLEKAVLVRTQFLKLCIFCSAENPWELDEDQAPVGWSIGEKVYKDKEVEIMREINIPTTSGKPRLPSHKVDKIVIHAMSEYIDNNGTHQPAAEYLNSAGLSCHYMVTPAGNVITCADPLERTTWHARGYNTNSVGIELLVPGINNYTEFKETINNYDWVSTPQEKTLKLLCRELMGRFNMEGEPEDHIFRHMDLDPDRKVDPGIMFNWVRFIKELRGT